MLYQESTFTLNPHKDTADLVRAFLAKGRKVKVCWTAHAASAAPREHTSGLDRYQFRAFVRYSKEG